MSLEKKVEERKTMSKEGERSGMERESETLPPCNKQLKSRL